MSPIESLPADTQALLDLIVDLGDDDVQPTSSNPPESPEQPKYQEFEGPTVLPYRAFQHLHNMHIGPYTITCVKTGESVTKEVDLEYLEDQLGGEGVTIPTETVAVFIQKDGFRVIEEEDGCRFQAIEEAPGAQYTYQMVSSRVQICYYQVEGAPRQVAGTALYPAFHKEFDSLMDHDLVMKRHGFLKLEVEVEVEVSKKEEEEVDVVSIEETEPESAPESAPIPSNFEYFLKMNQLYNFLQLKGLNSFLPVNYPYCPAGSKENLPPPLKSNETPRNLKRRTNPVQVAGKLQRLDDSFYGDDTTFFDDSLIDISICGSMY